jgi:branched-chain amino acid transport system ATP-binding protein
LLEISNVSKYFGGLAAVVDLNLHVNQGEILGLIGPNGAGKTTVLNMISGTILPTSGRITLKSEDITRFPPHRIAQKGIARVFQRDVLFQNFTVLRNVLAGFHLHTRIGLWEALFSRPSTRSREKALYEKAMETLQFVGLSQQAEELAINLPHGSKRLLGLAIALATGPDFLLLDEPVTGMNAEEVTAMTSMVRALRDERGITSIVVEHNMRAVMSLCDRIAVLSYGRKIAEGLPNEIVENPSVVEAYLGAEDHAA